MMARKQNVPPLWTFSGSFLPELSSLAVLQWSRGEESLSRAEQSTLVVTIRWFLMGILLLGLLGTGVELLLLEHIDGFWQQMPLFLIGLFVGVIGWVSLRPSRRNLRVFQGTTILFLLSGLAGFVLHYQGNMEFELEMYPSVQGMELFWESMTGATPSLAPGTMIQLGLLGMAYSYRHPKLGWSKEDQPEGRGGP